MDAKKLYQSLDKEFEIDKVNEGEWHSFDLGDFATESFRKTYKGLVLDNSTEKFACIAIQKFFEELGVPSEFLEDNPSFEDYG